MARQLTRVCVLVCILAARYAVAQVALEKLIATEALLGGAKKDVFTSHLQRLIQFQPEHEPEINAPAGVERCSPAALTREKDCIAPSVMTDPKLAVKPEPTNTSPVVATATCTGPDCLVAAMPGAVETPAADNNSTSQQAVKPKVLSFGPMTQHAFKQLGQNKRSVDRSDATDDAGIPLPAAPSARTQSGDASEIPHPAAPSSWNQRVDASNIPLPADPSKRSDASEIPLPVSPSAQAQRGDASEIPLPVARKSGADFEMLFVPQSPAPATAVKADDFDMSFQPQTPSPDPQIRAVQFAESPAPAPQLQQQQPAKDSQRGPGRPPMTEQEAQRVAAQQAAQQAALERKREMVRAASKPSAGAPSRGRTSGASRPTAAKPTRRTEVERVLLADVPKAAAGSSSRHRPAAAAVTSEPQQRRQTATAAAPSSSSPAAQPSLQVSWRALDILSVVTVVAVAAMALFVVAAIAEDLMASRRAVRYEGTSLAHHWFALTRSLWRRCRRAFITARKQLTGHGSDLPMSCNEGHTAVARALAATSSVMHVFWTQMSELRNQHAYMTARGSNGGASEHSTYSAAAAPPAGCGLVYTNSSRRSSSGASTSPFSASSVQQQGTFFSPTEDQVNAASMAEIQLRRRH